MKKSRRGVRLPGTTEEAIDILERFVTRARRIEAHSLVKSQKVKEFAQPKYTLRFSGSSVSIRLNSRPEDEEVFESLAARVRPCIVDSEPIQLEKVVAAICVLAKELELSEKQIKLLDGVVEWYESHIAPHSYAPIAGHEEIEKPASNEVTPASDTLLGLGWFYADLVHADPNEEKKVALEFPYDTRYNQGVFLVSYLALIICSLLALIREINDSHDLGLSPEVWTSQVTAGGGPCEIGIGDAYIGPAGCVPPQSVPMNQIPGFKELDIVTAMRIQHPSCVVDARLIDGSGNTVDTFEGFYAFNRERNSAIININDEFLLEGKPESDATPVEELPFERAFFAITIGPVDGKIAQFERFLERLRSSGQIYFELTWHERPVKRIIACTSIPPTSNDSVAGDAE